MYVQLFAYLFPSINGTENMRVRWAVHINKYRGIPVSRVFRMTVYIIDGNF